MTIPFSTGKTISINQLSGVDINSVANNDFLQYNSTNGVWDNGGLDLSGQDINVDEIDCRVLRVSETADIVGRLANQGVASFVNDGFIFQNGVSNLGDTLYIDNVNNRIGINYATPEQAIDCAGNIKIRSTGVERLIFHDDAGDHNTADIDAIVDGTNGGLIGIRTKVDGGSVTEKLRINNIGAISIGGGANYGDAGSVLTSNGSGSAVSWNSLYHARIFCNIDTNFIPANTDTIITNFILDSDATTTNAIGDFASNAWTPPAGIYQFNGQASVSRIPGGDIYEVRFALFKNGVSIRLSRINNENNSSGWDIQFSTLNLCDIIHANGTDVFDLRVNVQINGGGTYSVRADSTFLSVYKIG